MTDLLSRPTDIRTHPLTADWYNALVGTGALEGQRVELVAGALIEMSPQLPIHSYPVQELNRLLIPLMQAGYAVRIQLPLHIDAVSVPEPEIAVTDVGPRGQHPTTAHLVVEVANSSPRLDLRHKAPRYARAGVPVYIVMNVEEGYAVLHSDPGPDGYGQVRRGDTFTVLGLDVDLGPILRED